MAVQGCSCHGLALAALVHGRSIKIVHSVSDGIVHESVDILLNIGQAHHAEAQQRDLVARAMFHPIGHLILSVTAFDGLWFAGFSR